MFHCVFKATSEVRRAAKIVDAWTIMMQARLLLEATKYELEIKEKKHVACTLDLGSLTHLKEADRTRVRQLVQRFAEVTSDQVTR